MAWLILLVVFWQPIWWTCKAIYYKFNKQQHDYEGYILAVKGWFITLWELVKPSRGVI